MESTKNIILDDTVRRSVYKEYSEIWETSLISKAQYWGIFEESMTVEIPTSMETQTEMAHYIPRSISDVNSITETNKYFVINGVNMKKVPFLSKLLQKYLFDKIEVENGTTGRLFITIDPRWIARCSDGRYTSWESCFSPNGCHIQSCMEFITSPQIAMAMITNSEMTKMVGRRFIMLPTHLNGNGKMEKIISLKHYGTFPIGYQRELTRYLVESIFEVQKKEWEICSDPDDREKHEELIEIDGFDSGGNWQDSGNGDGYEVWVDPSRFIIASEEDKWKPGAITMKGLRDMSDDDDEPYCYCAYCDDAIEERDNSHAVQGDGSRVCDYCFDKHYVYDDYNNYYIVNDDSVGYHPVICGYIDPNSDYTTNEYNPNLIEISIVDETNLTEWTDSEILNNIEETVVVTTLPNNCIEINGSKIIFMSDYNNNSCEVAENYKAMEHTE